MNILEEMTNRQIQRACQNSVDFTTRDKFAVAAMQTLLGDKENKITYSDIAKLSYDIADEMLKARKEK